MKTSHNAGLTFTVLVIPHPLLTFIINCQNSCDTPTIKAKENTDPVATCDVICAATYQQLQRFSTEDELNMQREWR